MTKKEFCKRDTIAVYSFGLYGLEIKGIEHGINEYVYYIDYVGICHRSVIKYNTNSSPYFIFKGHRIPLDECIRTN